MTAPTPNAVLADIANERARQDAKWGEQNHPDGTGVSWASGVVPAYPSTAMSPAEHAAHLARNNCQRSARRGDVTWRHILLEETAEAFAETDPGELRAELVQVAAVAAAWIEAIDRREVAEIFGPRPDGGEGGNAEPGPIKPPYGTAIPEDWDLPPKAGSAS